MISINSSSLRGLLMWDLLPVPHQHSRPLCITMSWCLATTYKTWSNSTQTYDHANITHSFASHLQGMKTLSDLFSDANSRASWMEWGRKRQGAEGNKFAYPLQVTKICELCRLYVLRSEQADGRLDQIGFMDKDRNGEAICIA